MLYLSFSLKGLHLLLFVEKNETVLTVYFLAYQAPGDQGSRRRETGRGRQDHGLYIRRTGTALAIFLVTTVMSIILH